MRLFLLFLLFVFPTCKNTTNVEEKIPLQSQDDLNLTATEYPRFTNKDFIEISGKINGYKYIHCNGGKTDTVKLIEDSLFTINVSLKQNAENNLILFAEDDYERFSDTTYITIIHDNIPPRLLSSTVSDDSVSYNINLPIKLDFECPVISQYFIISAENHAEIYLNPDFSNEQKSVEMKYENLGVGKQWWLKFSVQDSATNSFDSTLYFKTYLTQINFGKQIVYSFLSQIHPRLYVIIEDPNVLYVIDTNNLSIIKQIYLSAPATKAAENPYNGYIYITSHSAGKIMVVDIETEDEKASLIPVDKLIPPTDVNLWEIDFAKNGVGLVQTHEWALQLIDSRNNNKMSFHSDFHPTESSTPTPFSYYRHEKIIIAGMGGSFVDFHLYDYHADNFQEILTEYDFDYCNTVVGNKFNDIVVFSEGKETYCITPDLDLIGPVRLDGIYDFTNLTDETYSLYYIDDRENEIGVYDFQRRQKIITALSFGSIGFPSNLEVSLDGNYIFLINYGRGNILIVEPKTFR